jgi:ketosteroid isomerase-like protein
MKSAVELMDAYLELIGTPQAAAALFADDGAIELPYLATLGLPTRTEGPVAIEGFLKGLLENFPGFAFSNIQHLIVTPDQVFSEYAAASSVKSTGRAYRQSYTGRLVAADGKIKLLRETLDTVAAARAVFPNGLADLPAV